MKNLLSVVYILSGLLVCTFAIISLGNRAGYPISFFILPLVVGLTYIYSGFKQQRHNFAILLSLFSVALWFAFHYIPIIMPSGDGLTFFFPVVILAPVFWGVGVAGLIGGLL